MSKRTVNAIVAASLIQDGHNIFLCFCLYGKKSNKFDLEHFQWETVASVQTWDSKDII